MTNASGPGTRWFATTLRWIWGADDDESLRDIVASAPITWILLAVVTAVSLIDFTLAGTATAAGQLTHHLGISPGRVVGGQLWRLITTAFVNPPEIDPPQSGMQHLISNAIPFVFVGPRVERSFGRIRYVLLFLVATIGGAASIILGTALYWPASGGTSGAVYGLYGAVLALAISRRGGSKMDKVFLGVVVVLLINLAFAASALSEGTNVSHLGGFISGLVIATVWCARPARPRAGTSVAVAITLLAGVLVAGRSADARRTDLTIEREIPIGFAPEVVTHAFGALWVTGEHIGVVARVDPESGRVVARVRELGAGGIPVATRDRMWVAGQRSIFAIDPSTNRVVERIELDADAWGLAATSDALWAALPDRGEVVRIDLRTRKRSHAYTGSNTYVAAARGSNVWVTSYGGRQVSRLDASSGRVIAQNQLATPLYLTAFLDGSLWVGGQPVLYRLDPQSLRVLAKIEVGSDLWMLTPDGRGNLAIAQKFGRRVTLVDPRTNTVRHRFRAGLRQPTAVVFVPDAWIVDAAAGTLVRLGLEG